MREESGFQCLQKSFRLWNSVKDTKKKLGGVILKSLSFDTDCADFAQIFFKSHVITKYKKSRLLSVCLVLKKISNNA